MRLLAAAWVLLAAAAGVVPVAGQADEWFDTVVTAMDAGGRGYPDTAQAHAERHAAITDATAEVTAQGHGNGNYKGKANGYAKAMLKKDRKDMKAMAKDKKEAAREAGRRRLYNVHTCSFRCKSSNPVTVRRVLCELPSVLRRVHVVSSSL